MSNIIVGARVLGVDDGEGTVLAVALSPSDSRRGVPQEWALVKFDSKPFPLRAKTKYLTALSVTVTLNAADAREYVEFAESRKARRKPHREAFKRNAAAMSAAL